MTLYTSVILNDVVLEQLTASGFCGANCDNVVMLAVNQCLPSYPVGPDAWNVISYLHENCIGTV